MAAITTRAGKGSPLTNAELDSNFTNINDGITTAAAITGGTINGTSIGATTPSTGVFSEIDVDNLELNGNAIISTDTNGNIDLTPNGTGTVNVTKLTNSSLTSGRVTYATTAGLLTDSANLLYSGTDLTVYGLTVGRGAGAVATNTAVGASALAAITTGARNTAIGYNSLLTNSTGGLNTAVGEGSLKNNTAGNNTAVGVNSLLSNTSGSENTAIGRSSASVNTTGASLVAVGYGSLDSNTTGSNNVAVGLSALAANTTASNNTAVGYQAGYSNTTGTFNTFLGQQSGRGVTTGTRNTLVGDYCGELITTGERNTVLGRYNGNQGGLDIRTASNYIVLSDGDGNVRGTFDGSGNLLVGTTSVIQAGKYSSSFDGATSNGIVLQTTYASTGTDFVRCVNSAGTAIGNITQNGATTVAYNTSSDYRLKNTITAMTGALAKVALLKPVTYKWNADGSNGEGFIAHELAEVVPDCVSGEKDGLDKDGNPKYQGIDTSFLVATLTAAIQEQQALIIQLQADVAALKGA